MELKRSSGGVFYIYRDGKMVFSRHETGRYPNAADVQAVLAG